MNAKVKLDLYRLSLPQSMRNTMVIGTDVVNMGHKSIIGFTASYS